MNRSVDALKNGLAVMGLVRVRYICQWESVGSLLQLIDLARVRHPGQLCSIRKVNQNLLRPPPRHLPA